MFCPMVIGSNSDLATYIEYGDPIASQAEQ